MNINDERRKLLGQIQIVRERIDRVEEVLIREPEGGSTRLSVDQAGNLALQLGMLAGQLGRYDDAITEFVAEKERAQGIKRDLLRKG